MEFTSDHHKISITEDKKYMLRCLQIAKNGLGTTAPNPMVGSVIVYDHKIIGEGYTSAYGGAHAEVNAINSVKDKALLAKSTLYVTLEPCSHFGKTPPCADLIVKNKIPNVVVGLLDPNPMVSGKGIEKLKAKGSNVITGILEKECREHHKRFLMLQENKRPYIILKWAETEDGFMAPATSERKEAPEPYWITDTYSRQLVHKWRSEEQAILVGTHTVLADNPKLDVRHWAGKNPFRVVIDKDLKIDSKFNVLDKTVNTLVLTEKDCLDRSIEGVNYELLDFSEPLAAQIARVLWEYGFTSVLVEGGRRTLQTFIDENLWDEARIFKGRGVFKNGLEAPKIKGTTVLSQKLLNDYLIIIKND